MASASYFVSEENFLCSVCLDVFTTPVTLPCGHNFCKDCITQDWRINRRCKCPLCKSLFDTSIQLHNNVFISEMVVHLKQARVRDSSAAARVGDVPCDLCAGTKMKALKSCLVCLVSYCGTHLERHRTVPGLQKHKLIDPLPDLENRTCNKQDKLLELYCKFDQVCECSLCRVPKAVPQEEECKRMKAELRKAEVEYRRVLETKQWAARELRSKSRCSGEAADNATGEGIHVCHVLIHLVKKGQASLTEQVRNKQKTSTKHTEGLVRKLEAEISELTWRCDKAERLLRTDDNFNLLHNYSSLMALSPAQDGEAVRVQQPSYKGTVARAVARIKKKLGQETTALLQAELKRVRRYAVDVTLDPNTAHPELILSEDGKGVKHGEVETDLPDSWQRFSNCVMVLGRRGFSSGKFYYEVEVTGKTRWDLGVASGSANRKGQVISSPEDGYWTLQLRGSEYVALANPDVVLCVNAPPQKVGVFADYEEGVVSFHDADTADIIYSYEDCAFNNALYPFVSPCLKDGGANSAPLRISDVTRTCLASNFFSEGVF